jgi:hypothetical protein
MGFKGMTCEDVDLIQLTQDSAQRQAFCEHGGDPSGFMKDGERLDY